MSSMELIFSNLPAIGVGLKNTLLLFLLSSCGAFTLACCFGYSLEGHLNYPRRVGIALLDCIRMSPFLIYLYLIYYGLPEIGIELDAWQAGFVALITYYASYYTDIIRAGRAVIAQGQAEAAAAHGFLKAPLYWRLMLPQVVLKSGPQFGNQLVCCLKDTAFLSIITLTDLTAVASALQARYFMPLAPFLVVIGLYWLITIGTDRLMKQLERSAKSRGLINE